MNDTAQNQNNLDTNSSVNPVPPINPVIPPTPAPSSMTDSPVVTVNVNPAVQTQDPFTTASSTGSDVPPPPPPSVIGGNLTSSGPNPGDVVEPSFIPTYPKQGSGNKRLIGAFMGILVLVVAGVVGVGLITNPKETQKSKASAAAHFCEGGPVGDCDPNNACWVATATNRCRMADTGQEQGAVEYFSGNDNWDGSVCYTCPTDETILAEDRGKQICDTGSFVGGNPDKCGGGNTGTTPPGNGPTNYCSDVKAFDASGNRIETANLKNLQPGTKVKFSIQGLPNQENYGKARFTINGGTPDETRQTENGRFVYNYTIPAGVSEFRVKGEVYLQGQDRWIDKQQAGDACALNFTLSSTSTTPPGPTPTDTAPTPTAPSETLPPEVAQCRAITIYDTQWNVLTPAQLTALKAGDVIRVSVSGNPDAAFDQARFVINGTTQAAVTQKKPNTQEFYDEYTIPAEGSAFSVNAQLHHVTLNIWI